MTDKPTLTNRACLRDSPRPPRLRGRIGFSLGLKILFVLACAACAPREPARPPNVVFILADDLGWADVGFQGSRFHRTPHLDALARRGLVFTNAYAGAPVCSPSRACLQTGLAPARTHFTANIASRAELARRAQGAPASASHRPLLEPESTSDLPPGAPRLAGLLAEAGYRTAMLGKWHLGTHPREAGYQVVRGPTRGARLVSYFPPYFAAPLVSFPDGPPGEYVTDRLTDEALAFIEENRDRPFFLYLAHFAPHSPYQAKPELEREFAARADPREPQHNPTYAAMIASLDESVGRVVAALERLDLAEDTLLVFTSDNGAFERRRAGAAGPEYAITSNLPLRSGKGHLYEGGLRVPAIFAGAGVAGGRTCSEPIVGMDLLPTLVTLAGRPVPAGLDGEDLGPLLRGAEHLAREELYFHFPHQVFQSALRAGDEKLVRHAAAGRDELFDLARDPGEARDLAAERPERARELGRRLTGWLERAGARLPAPNPAYVPGTSAPEDDSEDSEE